MNLVSHFWGLILATVIALLPLINPFAAAPTFLAITEGDTPARRNQQLRMACFYMVAILVSFLIGGTFIMGFFGISIPGLRIAGGLLVAGIGSGMLVAVPRDPNQTRQEHEAARAKRDIAFSPLAMPMLSGPGAIAVTIGLTSLSTDWTDYIAIIIGILIVAVIIYVTLRLSGKIVLVIGQTGMNALTKVMGFLILCVGIQFIVNGVSAIVTDPEFLHRIRDALASK
ncbi:MAG: MarC family NAAT transporter [Cephaloticoccus sp.]|nr:MarC family NAAT transporter [Cephaloticoccus sp.]MCF7758916.1 MarC family NAAT transporter [Cephaloticoccus sp.]